MGLARSARKLFGYANRLEPQNGIDGQTDGQDPYYGLLGRPHNKNKRSYHVKPNVIASGWREDGAP